MTDTHRPPNGCEPASTFLRVVPDGRARLGEAANPTPPPWYVVRASPQGQIRGPLVLGKTYSLDRCLDVAKAHAPALVIEHDLRDWSAVVWRTR